MLITALALNLLILVPLVISMLSGNLEMDAAFGGRSDARMILTAIYGAIALVSAGLIILHITEMSWAVPMTVGLFAVQITYKLATVPMVGLQSPVVAANMLVAAVQIAALLLLWRAG